MSAPALMPSYKGRKIGGYQQFSMPNFTQPQMDLFKGLFSHVGPNSYLSRLASGDQGIFEQIEKPALNAFSGAQGNIASRFAGMGYGSGGLKSSGFQNTMSAASQDLAERLAANRQALQQGAISDLLSASNQLLNQRPYENRLIPQKTPWWQYLMSGAGEAAGKAIPSALMMMM